MNISIIICTCNRSNRLTNTLESLEKMVVPEGTHCEVILVDNNSRDNTREVVKRFVQKDCLSIEYILERQSGKSFALNTGIKFANGEIIAFTDDDVIVDKDWLLAIANATERYKEYNCFGGRVKFIWEIQPPPWLGTKGKYNALRGFLRDDGVEDMEYDETISGSVPAGVNMFFRRGVIEANGLFRTDLGPRRGIPGGSEDTEFCKRMLVRGEKSMYVGSAIVYHPVEPEKINKKALLQWRYHCARTEIRSLNGVFPGKRIKGVPRYLFSIFFKNLWCWSISLEPKKKFFYKLKLTYLLGEIAEHYHKSSK